MRKALVILSLALALLAFGTFADDAPAPTPEPAQAQQEAATPSQPAVETEAPAATDSPAPAPQDAVVEPFAAEPFQGLAPAAGQTCGGAICGKLEYCCNPTCSLCLPFNMSCTQQAC